MTMDITKECGYYPQYTAMIVIFLILWAFLIPFFITRTLYQNRYKRGSIECMIKFGFLYHEYKDEAYYWELINFFFRFSIVLSAQIFSNKFFLSSISSYFLLEIYQKLFDKLKPYKLKGLNNANRVLARIIKLTILYRIAQKDMQSFP